MYLECTCVDISQDRWGELMKDAKPINYEWLKNKIKRELPELYNSLCLNLYNPWENDCMQTKAHYILVHSAIEYFIRKDESCLA